MKTTDLLSCFCASTENAIPLHIIPISEYADWLGAQDLRTKTWIASMNFKGEVRQTLAIPDTSGELANALVIAEDKNDFWALGAASKALPAKVYQLSSNYPDTFYLAWALAQYEFTRYKASTRTKNLLVIPESQISWVDAVTRGIYFTRDLINMPTEDMGPAHLAILAENTAKQFKAEFSQIVGDDLLKHNFPAIHTVGRASHRAPRLIELKWGQQHTRKITLVGKGVCFDTGGLDMKSSHYMRLMKKDMGGAAHVLGLARMIMSLQLPIHLQVLIPAVENSIAGNAYRPGDVIKMRSGLSVEVGNTDAEGRLVLADALAYAAEFNPELIIDMATLTGAARIALGTELAVFFSNNKEVAQKLLACAEQERDPMWQLPLHQPYRDLFRSQIADMDNSGEGSYGGAIIAALFLESFIKPNQPWLHFDIMAWNLSEKPGRPVGGEAMGLRALLSYFSSF